MSLIYLCQRFSRYYKIPENIFSPKADTFILTCTNSFGRDGYSSGSTLACLSTVNISKNYELFTLHLDRELGHL